MGNPEIAVSFLAVAILEKIFLQRTVGEQERLSISVIRRSCSSMRSCLPTGLTPFRRSLLFFLSLFPCAFSGLLVLVPFRLYDL
jgi:hypothetical protein